MSNIPARTHPIILSTKVGVIEISSRLQPAVFPCRLGRGLIKPWLVSFDTPEGYTFEIEGSGGYYENEEVSISLVSISDPELNLNPESFLDFWEKYNFSTGEWEYYSDNTSFTFIMTSNIGDVLFRPVLIDIQTSLIKYGKLYAWDDLNFNKEFIDGMAVPTDTQWTTLTDYINTNYNQSPDDFGVGNHLKHPRKNGTPVLSSEYNTSTHPRWGDHHTEYGRDTVNFGALPGGSRTISDNFHLIGDRGFWWSATEFGGDYAWNRVMNSGDNDVERGFPAKGNGGSLRCVRTATQTEQNLDDGVLVEQVQDYNENWYDLIKIGTQVWTRQNIAATHYTDGTAVTSYDYDDDDSNTFFTNEEESIWPSSFN